MYSTNLLNNNENLMHVIFSFSNVKDLSVLSRVNKSFHKLSSNFNNYWRDACDNFFCSPYETYR